MASLRLRHDERVVLLGDLAELFGLLAWNIDRALPGEGRVVEVEHFIVERLQRSLREGDQPHRNIEARQPRRRLHQVREMLEVDLDVLALADAAHGGDEADGGVRLDHARSPSVMAAPRPAGPRPRDISGW